MNPILSENPDCPIKAEVRESLRHGVDILSFSQSIPRDKAIKYREPVRGPPSYLYTRPLRHKEYTRKKLGRRDYSDPANNDPNSIIGYYPILNGILSVHQLLILLRCFAFRTC